MTRTTKFPVTLTANVKPSRARLGEQIRLSWTIVNGSESKVQILGYQLQFVEAGNPEPDWSKKGQRINSSPHVSMEIWPKETRSYEWSEVTPEYYGITSPGIWICYVRFAISETLTSDMTFTEPAISAVAIDRSSLPISEAHLSKLFTDNLELIVTQFLKWDEMPNVRQELRMENRGIADLVLYTSSGMVAVVEIKRRISNRRTLSATLDQLSDYADWASNTLAKSRETVWPILYVSDWSTKMDKMLSSKSLEKRGLRNLLVLSNTHNHQIEIRKSLAE